MTNRQVSVHLCEEWKVCVVIPSFNNAETVVAVVEGVKHYCRKVIVVNDGSTDDTEVLLRDMEGITLVSYPKNRGKGFALKTGFTLARELGYRYAVTIDSDGQHDPCDMLLLVKELAAEGDAVIIGARNMKKSDVPSSSSFGMRFSNFWFRVETGIRHPDTQSGFRLYPLEPFEKMLLFTNRFEFEIESIVRLAWRGIRITSVPIGVVYMAKGERVSHFRPFQDFLRISLLNTCLVFLALFWFRPLLYLRQLRESGIRQLLTSSDSSLKLSLSVAFGVFMGIMPIWGFQLITAIAFAFLFRLNKLLVILFSNISIPPFIPLILYLSMLCGTIWVKDPAIMFPFSFDISLETVKPFIMQYVTGSITLGFITAIAFGILARIFLYARKSAIKD